MTLMVNLGIEWGQVGILAQKTSAVFNLANPATAVEAPLAPRLSVLIRVIRG